MRRLTIRYTTEEELQKLLAFAASKLPKVKVDYSDKLPGRPASEIYRATKFLKRELRVETPVDELVSKASKEGLRWSTVKKAARKLNISKTIWTKHTKVKWVIERG